MERVPARKVMGFFNIVLITRPKVKSNMSEYEILHKLLIEVKKELSTKASDTQINELLAATKEKNEKN